MVKLEPNESKERFYVRVARHLADYIGSHQVVTSCPEHNLAEMLKVSRLSNREVMIALEVPLLFKA